MGDEIRLLDDWIEEHRREIDECPANRRGYQRASSLRWGMTRLLEYRDHLLSSKEGE